MNLQVGPWESQVCSYALHIRIHYIEGAGVYSILQTVGKSRRECHRTPLKGSIRATIRDLLGYYNNVGT